MATMASRRTVITARSFVAAAVRPTAWRATAGQGAPVTTAAQQSLTTVAFASTWATRAIARTARAPLAVRFYSAGNAKPGETQHEDDRIPGSKRWEFEDITKQLETGEDSSVIFVGKCLFFIFIITKKKKKRRALF